MTREPAAQQRIVLAIDRKGWRTFGRMWFGLLALTIVTLGVSGAASDGLVNGLALVGIATMLFSPMLWVPWFAFRAARSEAWIDAGPGRLTLHHPVFLTADLDLSEVTRAFYIGEASGYAKPSRCAPDFFSVREAKRWNLVLVFNEAMFVAGAARRATSVVRDISKGTACLWAPRRKQRICGVFGVMEDPTAGAGALEAAGIERLRELSPDVLRWLAGACRAGRWQ